MVDLNCGGGLKNVEENEGYGVIFLLINFIETLISCRWKSLLARLMCHKIMILAHGFVDLRDTANPPTPVYIINLSCQSQFGFNYV